MVPIEKRHYYKSLGAVNPDQWQNETKEIKKKLLA